MTKWSELDELELVAEPDTFGPSAPVVEPDEFDPSAPMATTEPELSEPLDELDEVDNFIGQRRSLLDDTGNFDLSYGFSDPTGMVRIWVDENLDFTRVRVGHTWRDRLADQGVAPIQGLTNAFGIAFLAINNSNKQVPTLSLDDDARLPEVKEPLSWEALARFNIESQAIFEQLEALDPNEGHGSWTGTPAQGLNASRTVMVKLSLQGAYSTVDFDRRWLEQSRASQVATGVLEAARAARQNFVPPDYEPGQRDILHERHQQLRDQMRAMMRRGFH